MYKHHELTGVNLYSTLSGNVYDAKVKTYTMTFLWLLNSSEHAYPYEAPDVIPNLLFCGNSCFLIIRYATFYM